MSWQKNLESVFADFMAKAKKHDTDGYGPLFSRLKKICNEWLTAANGWEEVYKMFAPEDEGEISAKLDFAQNDNLEVGIVLVAKLNDKLIWKFFPEDRVPVAPEWAENADFCLCEERVRTLYDDKWLHRVFAPSGKIICFEEDGK